MAAGVGGMTESQLLGISESAAAETSQAGMPDNGWPVVANSAAAAAWEARRRFLCHCWDPSGKVLAANDYGWLMRFDPMTGECIQTVEPCQGAAVSAMFVTSEFVIAGCTDGVIRVLELDELTLHRQLELKMPCPRLGPPGLVARGLGLPPGEHSGEHHQHQHGGAMGVSRGYSGFRAGAQHSAGAITCMAPLPDLSELVVATASGLVFRAPVDRLPPEDDEEEEGGVGAGHSASVENPDGAVGRATVSPTGVEDGAGRHSGAKRGVPDLVATAISDAPLGAILALQPLAQLQGSADDEATPIDSSSRFAAIAADGTLRVYEAPSGAQLGARTFWRAEVPAELDVDDIVKEESRDGGVSPGGDEGLPEDGEGKGGGSGGPAGAFRLGGLKKPSLHVAIKDASGAEPALSVSPDVVQSRVPTFGSAASGAGADADPLDEGGADGRGSSASAESKASEGAEGGEPDDAAERRRQDALAIVAIQESDAEAAAKSQKLERREQDDARATDRSLGSKAPAPGFTDELSCLAAHPRLPLVAVGSSSGHVRLVAVADNSSQHASATEGARAPGVLLQSVHCAAAHRHPVTAAAFCPGELPLLATMSGEGNSVAFFALYMGTPPADKLREDASARRTTARTLLVPVGSALLPRTGIVPGGSSSEDTFEIGRALSMAWRCLENVDNVAEVVISHASGAVSAVPVPSEDHIRTACAVVAEAAAEA